MVPTRSISLSPRDARIVLIALVDQAGIQPFAISGSDRQGYTLQVSPDVLTWLLGYPAHVVRDIVHDGLQPETRIASPFDTAAFHVRH